MFRVVGTLVIALALWLVPTPATAASRISVSVSKSVVYAGDQVIIRGQTFGLAAGVRLRLERRVAGTWTLVARARTTSAHRYRFSVLPPKGDVVYRVLKPFRARRALSSEFVAVRVLWRPVITGSVTEFADGDGVTVTRLAGTASGLASTVLSVQKGAGSSWTTTGTIRVGADSRYTVDFRNDPPATTYRLFAPANGARLAASSPTVTIAHISSRPRIVIYPSAYMRSDDVWVTKVWGLGDGVDLREVPLVLQRKVGDEWVDTVGPVAVDADGIFTKEFDSEPVGATFRFRAQEGPYREAAYSPPVTIDAVAWQPEVTLDGWASHHEVGDDGMLKQRAHYTGTSTAPFAMVHMEYRYPESSPTWAPCGKTSTTGSDGAFDYETVACPDGAELRAVLPQTGPALEATSAVVTSHLDPWQFEVGTAVSSRDFAPFYPGRGAVVTFDATAGQSITLALTTGYRTHVGLTFHVYGPSGAEVPVEALGDGYQEPSMMWIDVADTGTYTLVMGLSTDRVTDYVRVRFVPSKDVPGTPDQDLFFARTDHEQILNYSFTLKNRSDFDMTIVDPQPTPWRGAQEWCTNYSDFLAGGGPIPRLFHGSVVVDPPSVLGSWTELPAGDYTLKMFPCDDLLGNLMIDQDLKFAASPGA